ncbi:threonine/serine exporter family protein [Pelagibaculum spongiae]|uniref:Threonine/serine exporter n=1 Tax=Pelagibaculum spongiae TaxID=2080658 RepID=A0A2V1GVH3_9GAMM|nr:threonine/serine exporter family protein [Pelagibaculum spongiae]PVZ68943.1 threonine/serine exporter [Pelagibaculum spongiae]
MDMILIEKIFWATAAALGFATLFTVPRRTLWAVAVLAALGYGIRGLALEAELSLVLATLLASCSMGVVAIQFAHWVHTPTTVFMAPAVIPMVPGIYAYRFMMGLLDISTQQNVNPQIVAETASNGLVTVFVVLCLAVGVSLPSLLFKNKSVKEIRLLRRIYKV